MYRYIVEDIITYTPDDLVLFRASPFAAWMERLTLENPEHGIPPDLDSIASYHQLPQPDDDIVATLRVEGRNVRLIDTRQEEPARRAATLEAMRAGADFIVSGQLAVGNLSGAVDLLMRTSGFSELGDFLYIPCDTHADSTLDASFRLCFSADLLATLQGQLPPQMLIIRDGAEVVPLQTEDHIYYYRAVQKRFFAAMNDFRKHRMPDPAESAHFGRWGECASEVLKQRAGSERPEEQQPQEQQREEQIAEAHVEEMPPLRIASGAGLITQYDGDSADRGGFTAANPAVRAKLLETTMGDRNDPGPTLLEQAQLLKPDSYRNGTPPGHTPSLALVSKRRIVAAATPVSPRPVPNHAVSSALPEPVESIGSPAVSHDEVNPEFGSGDMTRPAPAPNLRDTSRQERAVPAARLKADVVHLPELEPRPPAFLPPDQSPLAVSPPDERLTTDLRASEDVGVHMSSVVDLDRAPDATLAPVVQRAEAVFERLLRDDPLFRPADTATLKGAREEDHPIVRPFSSSLQTNEQFDDN